MRHEFLLKRFFRFIFNIYKIIYQKKRAQTQMVEGRHANWQETLTFEMNCMDPLEFKNIIEQLKLNVFDQLVIVFFLN